MDKTLEVCADTMVRHATDRAREVAARKIELAHNFARGFADYNVKALFPDVGEDD
jgi:hypothetical protein